MWKSIVKERSVRKEERFTISQLHHVLMDQHWRARKIYHLCICIVSPSQIRSAFPIATTCLCRGLSCRFFWYSLFRPKSFSGMDGNDFGRSRVLFVRNFPPSMESRDVCEMLRYLGAVSVDTRTRFGRLEASAEFRSEAEALVTLLRLHQQVLGGRRIRAVFASPGWVIKQWFCFSVATAPAVSSRLYRLIYYSTIKALTLDLFFRRVCYRRNATYRKIKIIKVVEKLKIHRLGSVHFWYDSFKEATKRAKIRSKVSMRSKVRGFYGTVELYCAQLIILHGMNKFQ